MNLILASRSPRRQQILKAFGLDFTVRQADVDETPPKDAFPAQAACAIALRKAKEARAGGDPDDVIIGADTTVLLGERVLGKPADAQAAKNMLRDLSGQCNTVLTGVAVLRGDQIQVACAQTRVWFYPLEDAEIDAYVATGEPMDKAGAYAIQGRGALFVERIDGDYYNVVGLPVAMLARMLEKVGYPMLWKALTSGSPNPGIL